MNTRGHPPPPRLGVLCLEGRGASDSGHAARHVVRHMVRAPRRNASAALTL